MRTALHLACAALLLSGTGSPGQAASLSVAPTRVELGPKDRTAVVTLQNNADEAVMVQVQTFAWPRTPATDDLEPTRELIAVPPVFSLDARAKQIIRVATRGPLREDQEQAYRLLITEVPRDGATGSGVHFALRLSLPVFVTPAGAQPLPSWALRPEGGTGTLELVNRGAAHLHVRRIVLRAPGRPEPVQTIETPAYVLPGQGKAWPLSGPARAHGTLHVQAETNLGPIEASVALPQG
jgi:fimbrial chaperone protein